ncbi:MULTISPECIES: STAS domain-containing protein [unclassified Methanoregula]|uniref:STAS domain-containing protein n=1 Tax=unclassified Methanoregula TaxID=2649730 RepID=UPI0009D39E9F|nr:MULTISPECIES: STAS domain-containing protein [unclassified Methanoregula]OPX62857.1 MAG: STAS domain protein [Methanoregula sp. PtaB.Bin085]OPY35294.1 MAG: STAS domain protein [Methanoregula sp. PtaU1.Bin006]
MSAEITIIEGTTVVTLPRRFDTDSAPAVEKDLKPVIGRHPDRLLFDFSGTDYISSAGMRVLVKTLHTMKDGGGTVVFSSLNSHVEYVFEIAGFLKIFTICKTREKALKHLKKDG